VARWTGRLVVVSLVVLALAIATRGWGYSAMVAPSSFETQVAYAARSWLTPPAARATPNPVPLTPEVLSSGMAHWADHCATCHANDGSGQTSIGRSLYPPAPDMRGGRTQQMTDGELFYVIERGIPLTGMPGWGTGTEEGAHQSWELVRFIRHLPQLTSEDLARMEALNPRSAAQIENERRMQDFLKGGR
jgi:mono/diheme cytochrome c family protein